jgi:hypothetical protein
MATPGDGTELDAAVERALVGWARLRLRTSPLPPQFSAPPGVEIPGMDLQGAVDFTSDRCALDGLQQAMRLFGSDSYQQQPDGQWVVADGPEGSWGMFHPHGLLEGLRVAREHVLEVEPWLSTLRSSCGGKQTTLVGRWTDDPGPLATLERVARRRWRHALVLPLAGRERLVTASLAPVPKRV